MNVEIAAALDDGDDDTHAFVDVSHEKPVAHAHVRPATGVA